MSAQPELGQRLKQLRLARGLSQTDLASSEISASYVSLIESGRREPTQRALEIVAGHLGVTVDLIVTGVDPHEAENARLALSHAELALHTGDPTQAAAGFAQVASLESGALDADLQWRARFGLANSAERLGDFEQAIRSLEGLRAEAEARPKDLPWLPTMTALARCYREVGDLARSVDLSEEALRQCRELGLLGADGYAELASTLAATYFERGDLMRAATLLDEVIGRAEDEGTRSDRIAAHWNASIIAAERGLEAEALRLADHALSLLREERREIDIARLGISKGWMLLKQAVPSPELARDLLLDAISALEALDAPFDIAYARTELARAYTLLGDLDKGQQAAEAALETLGDDAKLERSRLKSVLGQCRHAQGDSVAALALFREAAQALSELGASRQSAAVWRELADTLVLAGQHVEAAAAFRQALDGLGIRGAS